MIETKHPVDDAEVQHVARKVNAGLLSMGVYLQKGKTNPNYLKIALRKFQEATEELEILTKRE